jgi:hypothetical protein
MGGKCRILTGRGIFDKETRRKPLVFAADAGFRRRAVMEKERCFGSGERDEEPISTYANQRTLTVGGVGWGFVQRGRRP